MRPKFKPNEGASKESLYHRKLVKEFQEAQYHKLPNEFRYVFTNYNRYSSGGNGQIDDNEYGHK